MSQLADLVLFVGRCERAGLVPDIVIIRQCVHHRQDGTPGVVCAQQVPEIVTVLANFR